MSIKSPNVKYKCVAFDAVGTLIHATPSVVDAYWSIGQRYGSELTRDVVKKRFGKTFSSRQLSLQTDEQSEYEFWQAVVKDVLGPVPAADECFNELYNHFGKPEAWRVDSDAEETIQALNELGIDVAIASNFDKRLNSVMDGHAALEGISHRVISSEIGWRKPSRQFYKLLSEKVHCHSHQILMIGDDFENDVAAARDAGLDAIQLVANNEATDAHQQIRSLKETLNHVIENG
ncbi:HAD-IA family hydrolase [Thalassoglobus polymorphus]|uniref:dUMP phosphatase n=1 Tax=Thalassoglobus polymorphus TaxID=2527994 RepID=A0A517QMS4_9PLAN|nr:HAD-IA family hydrolase [Thalassoglobus polymorphus]QDT32857.1 dUMP phosphatase [Thalassoglobus polymorphus]